LVPVKNGKHGQENGMAGRKPQLNWTKSRSQYTTTVNGVFHLLGSDKEEAEKQFRWLLNKHDLGEPVDTNPRFADVADAWLEHVKTNHDPDRYRLCKGRLTEFVRSVGERIRVRELRPRHVEEWMSGKAEVQKPGTKRQYKSIILAALNWAASKKVRLIPANPLKGLIELPEGDSRGGEFVWPKKIFDTVLSVANPAFADVVRILAWTGARPNTICKVERANYLADLRLWDVEKFYQGRVQRNKHVRRVWLSPQAVALVEKLNAKHPIGPIFLNSKGNPWTPDTLGVYMFQLRHKFKETKVLKWPKGLCLYGLRHTFATNFIKEHPDKLEYLRELLGHKDMKMIRKHYGHLFDEHDAIHDVLDTLPQF
jgi:integrase